MYRYSGLLIGFTIVFMLISVNKIKAENRQNTGRPSIHAKSMTTPVAWGSKAGSIFVSVGGTKPAPYAISPDGSANLGIGVGDPKKYIGIQLGLVSLDLTGMARYAMNIKMSHHLNDYEAIAVGAENIVLQDSESPSDGKESYYIVYSHSVQNRYLVNRKKRRSNLHYSIGLGNGRFREKSDYDIGYRRGKFGSSIFGNIAYDVLGIGNVITDWNGLNLSIGVAKTIYLPKGIKVGGKVGYADITENSGISKRIIGGISIGITL
jgi:hypothetical protein